MRNQLTAYALSTAYGYVLKNDERVHEVERALESRQLIIRLDQCHVGEALLLAILLGLTQHRCRYIEASDPRRSARQRYQQAADAASKVQCVYNFVIPVVDANLLQDSVYVVRAAHEKRAF